MRELNQNFIAGAWRTSASTQRVPVVSPVTEQPVATLTLGDAADVDAAVKAARQAFRSFSTWSREERVALLERIADGMEARSDEFAQALSDEIGCPPWLAAKAQVPLAIAHVRIAAEKLRDFEFERSNDTTCVKSVPIGVCGLISPWNFPISTITCKVAPALATGCTVVVKPSEFSPISARIFAEIVEAAGTPPGVFNLVYGRGEVVGDAISRHPDVDMVSITGSTRAGIAVAQAGALTVKRVHQELGGKSANIVTESADIADAVQRGVKLLMMNAGQGCSLPSRLLVPVSREADARQAVLDIAQDLQPAASGDGYIGPVVNEAQFESIQRYIQSGVDEGATPVIGGVGRPTGFDTGYFVQPTVFFDTTPDMRIVREEIFGPVLVVQTYTDIEDAIALANDTEYGLAAYVDAGSLEEARGIADRLVAGQVVLNGAGPDLTAPFGGVKQSGNGREYGAYGFEAFLEVKSYIGYGSA